VLKDLRYALRQLARTRAFTAAAILALALGIGVNSAIFSVMNALLLRYRPAHGPDNSPNWWFLMVMGRVAPGITERQALARAMPTFQNAAYSALGQPKATEELPKLFFTSARGVIGASESYELPLSRNPPSKEPRPPGSGAFLRCLYNRSLAVAAQ
jgi:hypothetical protein